MTARRIAAGVAASVAWCSVPARALGAPSEAGEFVHTPATEQSVNTPLPIYVDYPGEQLGRVIVKYAGTGVKTWSRLEMKRFGHGWAVLIPCADVKAGAVRYWIQGFDTTGEPVATSRDPKDPFVVPVRSVIASKPPHFPGRTPPQPCGEAASPPAAAGEGREPETTTPDQAPPSAGDVETATPPPPEAGIFARWWVGVSGALDFLSLRAGTDVCALGVGGTPANALDYYCTTPDGSDFPARTSSGAQQNGALVAGESGQLAGGIQPGDARVMLAVDYAVTSAILLGARLGYVMNSYPTGGAAVVDRHAFGTRIHVEARATYVFGDEPLARTGFAPTIFAGLGLAEFDGHTASVVSFETNPPRFPITQPVNVWVTSGPWFVAAGGGARYQFSQRAAFTGQIRLNAAFGQGALATYGPELQFQYGF